MTDKLKAQAEQAAAEALVELRRGMPDQIDKYLQAQAAIKGIDSVQDFSTVHSGKKALLRWFETYQKPAKRLWLCDEIARLGWRPEEARAKASKLLNDAIAFHTGQKTDPGKPSSRPPTFMIVDDYLAPSEWGLKRVREQIKRLADVDS